MAVGVLPVDAGQENPYHEHKLLLPYHATRGRAILAGQIPPPSTIEIDVTDGACNQACTHCCFGSGPHRKLRSIDVGMLLPFLAEAYSHGTCAFELVGGGEPTNHPRLAEVIHGIAALAEPGRERPHIGLVTNGVRLDRAFPVAGCLDWVRVSLDSADREVYNTLHGVDPRLGHFDRVLKHIRDLLTIIDPARVRVGYLVVPPNNHQRDRIFAAVELAAELGVKHIAFRPAFLPYDVDSTPWQEAAAAITEAKQAYSSSFVLGGTGGSWDYAIGKRQQPIGVCKTRPLVMVIKADGTIPSCILFRERLDERPALGKIADGFEPLWFSDAHKESLRRVDRMTCPNVCKHFRADEALTILEKALLAGAAPPLVDAVEVDNPHFI